VVDYERCSMVSPVTWRRVHATDRGDIIVAGIYNNGIILYTYESEEGSDP
jgi:hypothetical protein